jgi:rhomboid protease GluP
MQQPPDSLDDPAAPPMISDDMLAGPDDPAERIDFEQGMSPLPLLTLALIVANVAVFGWEISAGVLANRDALIAAGALVRNRVLQGEVWRLVTAMFLHADLGHLAGNCVVLYIVGMACEHAYGRLRTALVYFASGLCGSMLSMACHPGPSIGASGAIFGVIGCVVVFFYRYHRAVMLRDKRIGMVLLIWAAYTIATGVLDPFLDNFSHLGGLAGGALVGLLVRPTLLAKPSGPSGDASGSVVW